MQSILEQLQSPDLATRTTAESTYKAAVEQNPRDASQSLLSADGCLSSNIAARQLSRVLLRQIILTKWDKIDGHAVQSKLLELLEQPQFPYNEKVHLCQVVAAIPRENLVAWTELIPWTLRQAQVQSMSHVCVVLIGLLAEFAWESIASKYINETIHVLGTFLDQNIDVHLQLSAIHSFSLMLLSTAQPRDFQGLVENSVSTMLTAIEQGLLASKNPANEHSEEMQAASLEALSSMGEIFKRCLWALDSNLVKHVGQILSIVNNDHLPVDGRAVALEVVSAIADRRAKVLIKDTSLMDSLTKALLQAQCIDPDWEAEWEDDGQPLPEDLLMQGQKGLRGSSIAVLIALAEHSKANILPTLFRLLPVLLQSSDWQQPFAALSTIAVMTEAQGQYMKSDLTDVVQFVGPSLSHAHPRVRYAALACFQHLLLSEHLAQPIRESHGPVILQALCQILSSQQVPMVTSCACITLTGFCDPSVFRKGMIDRAQLDAIVNALVQQLSNAPVSVQEFAMMALSAVASVAKRDFANYYDALVPGIKNVIAHSTGAKANSALRAAAMSCIAAVAEAVGVEKFQQDAAQVVQLLLEALNTSNPDEMEVDGVLDFTRRVSDVMKDAFVPYLPHVMPVILHALSRDMDIQIQEVGGSGSKNVEGFETDADTGVTSMVKKVHGVGQMKVSANIYAMQLRTVALATIDELADALGAEFVPFVDQVAEPVFKATVDRFNVEAAISASDATASLFCSVWKGAQKAADAGLPVAIHPTEFLCKCMKALLVGVQIASEPDRAADQFDLRSGYACALERCTRICYQSREDAQPVVPPLEQVPDWTKVLVASLGRSMERRASVVNKVQADGYDEEDVLQTLYEVEEMEREFGENLVDSIGYMLKIHKGNFLPVFDAWVFPLLNQFIQPDQSPALRHNAICLFDDVIEFASPESHKYLDTCLPHMLSMMGDDDAKIRQAALYGISQVAIHAPGALAPKAEQVGGTIVSLIKSYSASSKQQEESDPDDFEEEDYAYSHENAVSALMHICRSQAGNRSVPLGDWLPFWVSQLPLTLDEDEAQACHAQLCQYIEEKNPSIYGRNLEFVPSVVKALGGIAAACRKAALAEEGDGFDDETLEVATRETVSKLANCMKIVSEVVPKETFQGAWDSLDEEERTAINALRQS